MTPGRFCLIWLGALVLTLAAVAGFDAAIDPYDVLGMPRLAGFNALKPEAAPHEMMAKTYQVARIRPVTVLLGTSRVDLGLDPRSPLWPRSMRPVYNFGVDGAAEPTVLADLRKAAATGRLRHAYVLLDFEDFLWPAGYEADATAHYRHTRDGRAILVGPWQRLHDMALSTLTLAAFEDSVATLLGQYENPPPITLTRHGFTTDADFRSEAQAAGPYDLFAQKAGFAMQQALRGARSLANRHGALPQIGDVRAMIAFCRRHDITLTLIVPPFHVGLLEIFRKAGLWPDFLQWQRDLVALLPRDGGTSVTLWNFSGANRYTTDPVPRRPGDVGETVRWYWEFTHFKPALGERMLARMLGRPSDGRFGTMLTRDNAAAFLAGLETETRPYVCGTRQPPLLVPWPAGMPPPVPCAADAMRYAADPAAPRARARQP